MRPDNPPLRYTLIVLADEGGEYCVDRALAAARRVLGGWEPEEVVLLEERELGAWMASRRAVRGRTASELRRVPERRRAVVVDADLF